ncbi:P-type conjugative transfer protein VirB9 [Notoacmeibacter sp. MSK16QG-6]|uniref:P-type conjugative transfer protein VirB9 n=1 Tax=Notoacmeibacter sp. MSK16QG-6 TaxID=2957982 RepID=UPI0020A1ACA8|nr:P-type conjugative transfer protein VirB9 [Notoacmeibacter sp. MSK16QG-6]MCP1201105.1 P-type conjugative transfer protein VirB9 [Notoacmeibacter sp. MSK16QG-6]
MLRHVLTCAAIVAVLTTHGQAAQTPRPGSLDSRVTSVTYQANNVVRVYATYGISTMIIFDETEKFQTISLGDTDSWQVVPADKGNILFVKPIARDVPTNMNIVTDKRIYYLELYDNSPAANKKTFGIRFIYPENNLNEALRKEAEYRAEYPNMSQIDKDNVNIDYSFSGSSSLKPTMVFDDGVKTYFKFNSRTPAIFRVQSDFSETLVNFRKEGDYLVVDGVATQFTLRDGNNWTCIFNLRKPDFGAPDPDIMAPVPDQAAKKRRRSGN